MSKVVRLCLDLNIWCAALLADFKGRQNTSSQRLVQIVRSGFCSLGNVELVISWGMLERLEKVLIYNLKIDFSVARLYLDAIIGFAQLAPQLTLGGTGILPLDDVEDAHVLETAIAGRADILVTANFKDFIANDSRIIVPERHLFYFSPAHQVQIVHPYLIMDWLNTATIPDVSSL
ncbi:MAG TPA: PIN domain-containing protein [Xenococcaceae cyanobacterium]|jgi:predicted nucleic acid-binding protein